MQVVVDILLLLYALGTPFTLVEVPGIECFQIWTVLAVFLLVFPIITAYNMVAILIDPFSDINAAHDVFNFDTLIVSSEQTIFASLRGGFDQAHIREEEDQGSDKEALFEAKEETPRENHKDGVELPLLSTDSMELRHRVPIMALRAENRPGEVVVRL